MNEKQIKEEKQNKDYYQDKIIITKSGQKIRLMSDSKIESFQRIMKQ